MNTENSDRTSPFVNPDNRSYRKVELHPFPADKYPFTYNPNLEFIPEELKNIYFGGVDLSDLIQTELWEGVYKKYNARFKLNIHNVNLQMFHTGKNVTAKQLLDTYQTFRDSIEEDILYIDPQFPKLKEDKTTELKKLINVLESVDSVRRFMDAFGIEYELKEEKK